MKRRFLNWLRRQLPEPRIVQIEHTVNHDIVLRRSDGAELALPTLPLQSGERWNVNLEWRKPKE